MIRKFYLGIILSTATLIGCKCEVEKMDDYLNSTDMDFIGSIGELHHMQAELVRLGEGNATTVGIKTYAAKSADEAAQANQQLSDIATSLGHTPTDHTPDSFKSVRQRLMAVSLSSFDSAYISALRGIEERKLQLLSAQITEGYNELLTAYSTGYLSLTQKNYSTADSLSRMF